MNIYQVFSGTLDDIVSLIESLNAIRVRNFILSEENGRIKNYYISDLELNWVESLLVCRSYGMNLVSIRTSEEFQYLNEIYSKDRSSFGDHTYIGGTNLLNQAWYWVEDGSKMTIEPKHWHTGKPNGQHEEEYCGDFIEVNNKYIINDVPCRSKDHIWKFLCEKFETKSETKNEESSQVSTESCGTSYGVIILLVACVVVIILMVGKIYLMMKKENSKNYDEMEILQ